VKKISGLIWSHEAHSEQEAAGLGFFELATGPEGLFGQGLLLAF